MSFSFCVCWSRCYKSLICRLYHKVILKIRKKPSLGDSVGWSAILHTQNVAGSISSQGVYMRQLIDVSLIYVSVCLSFFLSLSSSHPPFFLFLSLKSINVSLGEYKKIFRKKKKSHREEMKKRTGFKGPEKLV